ncbi:leucine zipper protein 2 [Cottoperca gobio]|uniref:Leucine zipper protein 2 n=1 Tax=Cottoperca gobio TaxID=56716 RepID=A0A6J2PEW8_COTGO|nr:leucine zipper protein 2 [Cottoperca gobio]
MKFIQAIGLLLLCPALSLNTRQSYDGLEKKLKEVFSERSSILHQLSKTSKELDSIKGNLQSLKKDDSVAKKDVQRILELSHKQREEMKSLQAALQKQLDEANEKAEKQQATIKLLKVEMEKKTKIIKDLQQENKSLKTKLLSGHKLCDAYAEESKKIQAQLKELRYGKKDLIFKGQQLMDLEHKLTIAKEELEKTALDKESQLKALKDTVHICFSAVLHNQPGSSHRFPTSHLFRYSSLINSSRVTYQQPHAKDISKVQRIVTARKSPMNIEVMRRESGGVKDCQMEKTGGDCFKNQTEESAPESKKLPETQQQRSQVQTESTTKLSDDSEDAEGGSSKKTKPHEIN